VVTDRFSPKYRRKPLETRGFLAAIFGSKVTSLPGAAIGTQLKLVLKCDQLRIDALIHLDGEYSVHL